MNERDSSALDPPRILHVSQPTTEGVAVVVSDWTHELVQGGWSVTVACPAGGYLQPKVEQAGGRHIVWTATRSPGPGIVGETGALSRVVASVRPDVVHLHSSKAGLAGRLAIRGHLPTVFSPHAWSFFHADGLEERAALAWERWAARWADVILCGSSEEVAAGRAAGIHAVYEMITNSIAPGPQALSRSAARARLGLNVDGPLVVCVGRLAEQKGQDVLLRGWPSVLHRVPDARLVLVGAGPDRHYLESLLTTGASICGPANREEVAVWIAAADILAFPSRWETLSLAVLESLALGRAVVVSDCSGMAEAMAGGEGRMVQRDDVEGFAEAIGEYLADLEMAQAEGIRAAEAYAQVHGVQRRLSVERYLALVTGLAQSRQHTW